MKVAEQNRASAAAKVAKKQAKSGPAKSYQDILRDQQSQLRQKAAAAATPSAAV
jgi:hypothetical protein